MPQAATQEGEASGSGPTLALRRGRSSTASKMPTTTARSTVLVRGSPRAPNRHRSRLVRSPTRKGRRGGAANQKLNKRTRTRDEDEEEDGVSSAGNSPIHAPQIPDVLYEDVDMLKAIQDVHDAYDEKLVQLTKKRHILKVSIVFSKYPQAPRRRRLPCSLDNAHRHPTAVAAAADAVSLKPRHTRCGHPRRRCCRRDRKSRAAGANAGADEGSEESARPEPDPHPQESSDSIVL